MKRVALSVAVAGLAASVQAAPIPTPTPTSGGMTVRTFLDKVTRLKNLGPLAITSPELGEVKNEARLAALALKQDADARKAAGKPPLSCPPKDAKMGGGEFLGALQSIPEAGRDIPLKQGFALVLVKRYPCGVKG